MIENVKSSMVQRCSMAYDLIAPLLNILNLEKGQLNYNLDAMFLHLWNGTIATNSVMDDN